MQKEGRVPLCPFTALGGIRGHRHQKPPKCIDTLNVFHLLYIINTLMKADFS